MHVQIVPFMFAKLYSIMKDSSVWKNSSIVLYKSFKGQVGLYLPLQQTVIWEVDVKMLIGFTSLHGYYCMSLCCESVGCVSCEVTAAV